MKSVAATILLLGLGLSPAAACGWENERCCSTKKGGEACKVDGLVCISGRCKPEPECGGDGEACCPGEECDLHSLVCLSGSCTPCGKEGEPVCNEDGVSPCNSGLEPSGGICALICGDEGWPCCADDTCKVDGLVCIADICSPPPPCGASGEECCPGDKCDAHSLGCVGGTCTPCGALGEPTCTEDGVSPCNTGLVDSDGICSEPPCGGNGETCCPGDKCDAHSLGCVGGTCVPCGKLGEPACTEDGVSPCNTGLVDSDGICSEPPCGGNGETCCPGDKCDAHSLGCVGGTCTPCGKLGEPTCTEDGVSPCNTGLVDSDGICSEPPCGGNGEECCPDDKCDAHSLGCVGGTCVPCGKEGEPACTEDGVSPCNTGLSDSAGICTDCGDVNEECCAGNECGASLICAQGFCLPCGGSTEQTCAGDTPCSGDLVAVGGFCQEAPEECGEEGEVCCPGAVCDDDDTICSMGFCRKCGEEGYAACDGDEPCEEGLTVSSSGLCVAGKQLKFGFKF